MANYKHEFFDNLLKNIRDLEGKLTTSEDGTLSRSTENTCHFANALRLTFCDMGDMVGMMAMISCDLTQIGIGNKR